MTPQTAQPPAAQPFDPVSDFLSQAQSLPQELPSDAYQGLQEQYFQSHVMPHVLKQGYDPESSHKAFMDATDREKGSAGKLLAKSMLTSLMEPFKSADPDVVSKLEASQEWEGTKVGREGGHPALWESAGSMLGQAPYWMAGMGLASQFGGAVEAGPMLDKAIKVAAGGMIQGSYDAAKAPAGRGVIEGLQGAESGAGMVAGYEAMPGTATGSILGGIVGGPAGAAVGGGVGLARDVMANAPLWRFLADSGVPAAAAKSVEQVVKGIEPVTDQTVDTVLQNPKLDMQVGDWMAQQVRAAKSAGVPSEAIPTDLGGKRIKVQMTGADGKPYNLGGAVGVKLEDINSVLSRMVDHLDAGGSIDRVTGDSRVVSQFFNAISGQQPGKFDLTGQLRSDLETPSQFTVPNADLKLAQTARASADIHNLINARNSVYHATDLEGMRGILEAGEIAPLGKELDWETASPADIANEQAKAAEGNLGVSVSRTPRVASKADKAITFVIDAEKMPKTRPYVEEGYGKQIGSSFGMQEGIGSEEWYKENAPGVYQDILASQQQRNPHFEFEQRTYNEPIPLSAVKGIVVDKEALSQDITDSTPEKPYPGELVRKYGTAQDLAQYEAEIKSLGLHQAVENLYTKFAEQMKSETVPNLIKERLSGLQQLADQYKIPIRFVESGRDLYSYRAGLSKLPPDQRFSIPMYDQLQELPTGQVLNKLTGEMFDSANDALYGKSVEEHADSPERVRGDGITLSDNGQRQVDQLGQDFARKGGLDQLVMTDVNRTVQTGQAILQHNPLTQIKDVTPATRSWGNGELVGAENNGAVRTYKDVLADRNPDTPIGGVDPDSGRPGESFNQVKGRVLPYIKNLMDEWQKNPDSKIGVVTHFTPIKVIDGWLAKGAPEDFSIDMPTYLEERASTAGVYRLAPYKNGWGMRKVNMANDQELQPGIYLIRHGETPWNKGAMPTTGAEPGEEPTLGQYEGKYKETPLAHRFSGGEVPYVEGRGPKVGLTLGGPGQKPSIFYDNPDRETIFHENIHGHMTALGLGPWFDEAKADDSFVRDVYNNWFPDEAKQIYQGNWVPEEVYAYAASALRTGNRQSLEEIAAADTDMPTTLGWLSDTSKDLLDKALEQNDSLHLRSFQRKLNNVISRSTNQLQDLKDQYHASPLEVDTENGLYTLQDGSDRYFYPDREGLVSHLEQEWQEPLQAPELVDGVPQGAPRLAAKLPAPNPTKPPISTEPPPPELTSNGSPIKAGGFLFSRFFRPFYDWLGDWTSKFDRQDIYSTFDKIRDARVDYNNAIGPYLDVLKDTLGKYEPKRQTDFYKYMQADDASKPFLEREFNLKAEELSDLQRWKEEFADPLSGVGGNNILNYMKRNVPDLQAAGWDVEKVFPKGKDTSMFGKMVQSGQLDPKDYNLLKVSATTLRKQMFTTHMEPAIGDAEELVRQSKDDLGKLYPLLNRHIAAIRGIPDYTQQMAQGVVQAAQEAINNGITQLNKHLPDSMQIDHLDAPPSEILQDYLTFSYAGMLGMRPGIWVRDASQFFVTSFPLLGKYTWQGMQKAMSAAKEGVEGDAFSVARKYGAFIEKNELNQMITQGGGEEAEGAGVLGKLEKWSQTALSAQRWAHNSNRLVSFWGHAAKVQDATEQFGRDGDLEAWTKNSDAWYMNKGMRAKYTKELQNLSEDGYEDFSRRMAKSLTELTQWNYNREASPGIYDYQLGRLFGQYGTWPLNYIEYARRFWQGGDKSAAAQALGRLVVAHGAILATGQAAGIDTSDWVFTQPMAYGGGPLLEAVTAVPNAVGDWQSERGTEARQTLKELVWPGIVPGGDEMYTIWKAVTTKDDDLYIRMLGFQPLEDADKQKGWHALIP